MDREMNVFEKDEYPELSSYYRYKKGVLNEITDSVLGDFMTVATDGISRMASKMKDYYGKKNLAGLCKTKKQL